MATAPVHIRNDNSPTSQGLIALFHDREAIRGRDAQDLLLALDAAGIERDSLSIELGKGIAHGLSRQQVARLRYYMGHFDAPARCEADLVERYPALLSELTRPADGQLWVFAHWLPVLDALCDQLQADADARHVSPPRIVQIKAKHGELRVYLAGGADPRQQGMLDLAARLSTVLEWQRKF